MHSRTWVHSLVKEVATKTNDVAGDGTTTATVLAQAMIQRGNEEPGSRCKPDRSEKRYEESN